MAAEGDDDLQLIRASADLLSDLSDALPKLLWKHGDRRRVHHLVRTRDLEYVVQLIEPFQAEPQLLDTWLKSLLPPLIDAYIAYLLSPAKKPVTATTFTLDTAVSKILYIFCKVRGEKVITGFLNNEPKYLELILSRLEACTDHDGPWETSYILLLWLGHLLFAPFDLVSISGASGALESALDLELPDDTPPLVRRVTRVGIYFISSATREQDASAKLLVRLSGRPDMQRIHLPETLTVWALRRLSSPSAGSSSSGLHTFLGPLRFLVGMTASPDSQQIANLVPKIYAALTRMAEDVLFAFLVSSAVTKKLLIKFYRNTALLSLQASADKLLDFFETATVLEDTVDFLLQSLADRDTPVRFAASKALSMIILRLDDEMGHEVVQAVLDSFNEDIPSSVSKTDFSTVNPLRWHGLTLTLAHALFRRSASVEQLPGILRTLLLALTFEQRSATGSSTGTNVRDAACFGIWSISRRYTTDELSSIDPKTFHAPAACNSSIQLIALNLLLAACFDPAGNIRRGASAALQELIGRHPDQVSNGIPLVQVVDYHAVGLRQRAMIDVAHAASCLNPIYHEALLLAALEWRGLDSPDVPSREAAAASIARLCSSQPLPRLRNALDSLFASLKNSRTEVERRHGCLMAVSRLIDEKLREECAGKEDAPSADVLSYMTRFWQIFDQAPQKYTEHNSRTLRAELFPAIAQAITSLADLRLALNGSSAPTETQATNVSTVVASLVARSEDTLLRVLPRMIRSLGSLQLSGSGTYRFMEFAAYLASIKMDSMSGAFHGAGRAMALAAAFQSLPSVDKMDQGVVLDALCELVELAPIIEWRIVGLQALGLIIEARTAEAQFVQRICKALLTGLNDYTVTERGDVGSLVRTQAIECVGLVWKCGLTSGDGELVEQELPAEILRLSLEKLDRVRLQAARCLAQRDTIETDKHPEVSLADVSNLSYFLTRLHALQSPSCPPWQRSALLKGTISCAGISSETLLRPSRTALALTLHHSPAETHLAVLAALTTILKQTTASAAESQPLLELLAWLLDTLPDLGSTAEDFNWRTLLSFVQKAHFKSTSIPRLLAAVDVYRGLARIGAVRAEVLRKLAGMLGGNPYPKVRGAVAECLWVVTGDEKLLGLDPRKAGLRYGEVA